MRSTLLALGFLLFWFQAHCQNRLEVGLKTKQVYYPHSIEKKDPIFKTKHLLLDDSIKIDMRAVDYYQTSSEYFIVRNVDSFSNQEMRRIEHGKLNLYSFDKIVYTGGAGGMGAGGMYGPTMGFGGAQSKHYYYYEKDKSLNRLSVSNLKLDLRDDQEAIDMVLNFQKKRNISYAVWGAGMIMTIVGLNQMVDESNENGPPYPPLRPNGLFISGLVMAIVPVFFYGNKDKTLLKAVKKYNLE